MSREYLVKISEKIWAAVLGTDGQESGPILDEVGKELVAVQLISGAFHDLKELGARPRERSRELVEWARTVVTQSIHPDITVSLNVVLAANGLADLVVDALEEYRSETSR